MIALDSVPGLSAPVVAGSGTSAVGAAVGRARLLGDTLRRLADANEADELAERLLARMQQPLAVKGHQWRAGASIAMTSTRRRYPGDLATLTRQADAGIYAAKRGGGAGWMVRAAEVISSRSQERSGASWTAMA